MDLSIRSQLSDLNRHFYEQFASSFSATRHQAQPGVSKLSRRILDSGAVLDVGCGNGTFSRALIQNHFEGTYVGVDMAESLLTHAQQMLGNPSKGNYSFKVVDLENEDWTSILPAQKYDWLVCFATLHHVPGNESRQHIIGDFKRLISKQGQIALSVWQWQNSPRLRKRVVPWSTLGLHQDALEEGDVLLDWRAGDTPGLRYVHTFSEDELAELAQKAGLKVVESFYSDGKTGNLALYQVWQIA